MEDYNIKTYGNSVLRKKAGRVKSVDDDIRKLAGIMKQVMRKKDGLGLAAPQIGVGKRIIVFKGGKSVECLINPVITWKRGKVILQEGCLSFPGISLEIKRAGEIGVSGLDLDGNRVELVASGLAACVIQHEVDHLDGVLIIDHVRRKELKAFENTLKGLLEKSAGEND